MKRLLISAKTILMVDQAIVSASAFLSNIIIARSLGITDYGVFSILLLVQFFILSLQQSFSTGVFQVLYHRFSSKWKLKYTHSLVYLQLVFLLILFLLGLIIIVVANYFMNLSITILFPALVATICFLLQDFLRKLFITMQKEGRALCIDGITNTLQLVLLFMFSFNRQLTMQMSIWIMGLTFIPSVVLGIIWFKLQLPNLKFIAFTIKWHRKNSGWILLSALLQWFAGNFFVLAAGWWLGTVALGALRLGQYIYGLLNVVLQVVENYAIPRGVMYCDTPLNFQLFLFRILKQTVVVIVPLLLIIAVFAKDILLFLGGSSFASYAYVLYGLALLYVCIVICLPIRVAIRVHLLQRNYFMGYVWATVFSILSAKFMIMEWQLSGVLIGLILTQLIVMFYWAFILNQKKIILWKSFTLF